MKPTVRIKGILAGVVAGGLIGAAAVAPAAAAPAAEAPVPVTPVLIATPPAPLLHLLPPPLDCLVTTGWALFCLGITSS
ncbi:hypothetical protein [Nocardia sp. NPDC052566]|uniref:hypothetical protein n=1 Tax=Nocardia sp. NPDC052566 TaxID=3364330 RepID=UPI0037CBFA0D